MEAPNGAVGRAGGRERGRAEYCVAAVARRHGGATGGGVTRRRAPGSGGVRTGALGGAGPAARPNFPPWPVTLVVFLRLFDKVHPALIRVLLILIIISCFTKMSKVRAAVGD